MTLSAPLMLACGPEFDLQWLVFIAGTWLLGKPLAFWGFAGCFKYRVPGPQPLNQLQAVGLAAWRLTFGAMGALIFGLAWTLLGPEPATSVVAQPGPDGRLITWFALSAAAWLVTGFAVAGFRGRSLCLFASGGTLISWAIDGSLWWTIVHGSNWNTLIAAFGATAALLVIMHISGSRQSLRRRYEDGTICPDCGYDLRANCSGRCPECGRPSLNSHEFSVATPG